MTWGLRLNENWREVLELEIETVVKTRLKIAFHLNRTRQGHCNCTFVPSWITAKTKNLDRNKNFKDRALLSNRKFISQQKVVVIVKGT